MNSKQVKVEILSRYNTHRGREFGLALPINDDFTISSRVTIKEGLPLSFRLTGVLLDTNSGNDLNSPLMDKYGRKDPGLTLGEFVSVHVPQVIKFLLQEERDLKNPGNGFLILPKVFCNETDPKELPSKKWSIQPEINMEIPTGKYLIMEADGSIASKLLFGWLKYVKEEPHQSILDRYNGYFEPLGGGKLFLKGEQLSLKDDSANFDYPPFELAYDAAKAIVQATSGIVGIRMISVQGLAQYPFSIPEL